MDAVQWSHASNACQRTWPAATQLARGDPKTWMSCIQDPSFVASSIQSNIFLDSSWFSSALSKPVQFIIPDISQS